MKKIALALLLGGAFSSIAQAHDSWLQPDSFQAASAAKVPVRFFVGHNGEQTSATLSTKPDWLLSLKGYSPRGEVDFLRQSDFDPGSGLKLQGVGTHVLSLETGGFLNEMDGAAFAEYLKEEGLETAEGQWSRSPIAGRKVRETYRRHAKTLVKVGNGRGSLAGPATRRLGFELEIVPGVNPYTLSTGDRLPAQVWFKGKPLQGALVTLGSLDRPTDPLIRARSDSRGAVSFSAPDGGRWMMNVVWGMPSSADRTDFETSFSSMTFDMSHLAKGGGKAR
jgi:uncharacterized GH25 family protein